MSIIDSIRRHLTPIHPEGYIFIAAFGLAALILGSFFSPLGWIGAIATAWCVYFFRDPVRHTPLDESLVIAPADGVVTSIGFFIPPPELGLGVEPMQRISVFMSVFDCHVNRAPVRGRVAKIAYRPGVFLNADLDKASEDNERNGLVIELAAGRFGVVQIAGLVARRIVCFVRQGESSRSRRAVRLDPVWFARRRLFAGGGAAAGRDWIQIDRGRNRVGGTRRERAAAQFQGRLGRIPKTCSLIHSGQAQIYEVDRDGPATCFAPRVAYCVHRGRSGRRKAVAFISLDRPSYPR